jgi:hypothetical protein
MILFLTIFFDGIVFACSHGKLIAVSGSEEEVKQKNNILSVSVDIFFII